MEDLVTKSVEISRQEIRVAIYPNWFIFDKLKSNGFPFKLKKNVSRFQDLDFRDVELFGCFKTFEELDKIVYEFAPVYTRCKFKQEERMEL